tara:strand:- start:217 stop:537 length:321 start_codon:yes stop_codon:yes gene_type:complete
MMEPCCSARTASAIAFASSVFLTDAHLETDDENDDDEEEEEEEELDVPLASLLSRFCSPGAATSAEAATTTTTARQGFGTQKRILFSTTALLLCLCLLDAVFSGER